MTILLRPQKQGLKSQLLLSDIGMLYQPVSPNPIQPKLNDTTKIR